MNAHNSISKRVLIIEDDFLIANELDEALRDRGFAVIGPVGSVDGALDLIDMYGDLDAAVLDINLHGTMAYPVADALIKRGIPFMLATGYVEVPAAYAGVPRMTKPVELDLVFEQLRDMRRDN